MLTGFTSGADTNYHATIGVVVMLLGYLQPLLSRFRPKAGSGAQVSFARKLWNLLHWNIGSAACLLAIANIIIGLNNAKADYGTGAGTEGGALMSMLETSVYVILLGVGGLWLLVLKPWEYLHGDDGSIQPQQRNPNPFPHDADHTTRIPLLEHVQLLD